jgi:hypothetical protein
VVPCFTTCSGAENWGLGVKAVLGCVASHATSSGPGSGCTVFASEVAPEGPVLGSSSFAVSPDAAVGVSSPPLKAAKATPPPTSAITSATTIVIVWRLRCWLMRSAWRR